MNRSLLVAALLLPAVAGAQIDAEDILIASTSPGAGDLAAPYDFAQPRAVYKNLCAGGRCLYSATDPGFNLLPASLPAESLYRLDAGVSIQFELVEIDPALSVKVGSIVLRTPGQSATLGTTPSLHIHPSWQINAPDGDSGQYQVSFRLRASGSAYRAAAFRLIFSTAPIAADSPTPTRTASPTETVSPTSTATAIPSTPTPTQAATTTSSPSPTTTPSTTPTATATTGPSVCPSDCNLDDAVTVDEIVRAVNLALIGSAAIACQPADVSGDGTVTVDEILQGVSAALNGCPPMGSVASP